MIDVRVPLRFEGIMTIEGVAPDGAVKHREVQHNLITDEGIEALKTYGLSALTDVCWLGRQGTTPTVADTAADLAAAWMPVGVSFTGPIEAYDSNSPPQSRTLCARSTYTAGVADAFAYTGGATPYWSLTHTRHFFRTGDYFQANKYASPPIDSPTGVWVDDGWGRIETDASYIDEVGFARAAQVDTQSISLAITGAVPPDPTSFTFTWPLWAASGLWNRVALAQSIGYEASVLNQWGGTPPDIVLAAGDVIRVTYELRIYPPTTAQVQTLDIDGVSTTVTTSAIDIDGNSWGPSGLAGLFGGMWVVNSSAGQVSETNTLPASVEDSFNPSGDAADDAVEVGSANQGEYVMQLRFGGLKGIFSTGIGCVLHGNFGGGFTFATTFSPKIAKLDTQRLDFNVRYIWSR